MGNGGAGKGGGLSQNGGFPKSNKCKQGGGGSKFWSFCGNVIIEWTPLIYCGWPKKVWIASFPDGAKAIDWNVAVLN